jgi:hypothetical protein
LDVGGPRAIRQRQLGNQETRGSDIFFCQSNVKFCSLAKLVFLADDGILIQSIA